MGLTPTVLIIRDAIPPRSLVISRSSSRKARGRPLVALRWQAAGHAEQDFAVIIAPRTAREWHARKAQPVERIGQPGLVQRRDPPLQKPPLGTLSGFYDFMSAENSKTPLKLVTNSNPLWSRSS